MSALIDIHPDDLLDRARRGPLGDDDRRRLDEHLEVCRACAIEHRLAADFQLAAEPDADPGDDERIARAIAGATRAHAAPKRRTIVPYAIAAAMMLMLALAYAQYRRGAPPAPAPPVAATPITPVAPPMPNAPPPPPPPAIEPSVVPAPIASAPIAHPVTPPVVEGAGELFARANEARRNGNAQEAARLYRALQKAHPASAEATTSRVALGRLLLDTLGDASGARAEFQAYLASAPSGTLGEEARLGLALAAAKLGDASLERRSWEELLAKHPDSVHAARAKKRLSELP